MACLTQMHFARHGTITPQMQRVAEREGLSTDVVRDEAARGRLIIPANVNHLAKRLDPMAIGTVARVKINANIGNSAVESNIDQELEKLHHAVHYGVVQLLELLVDVRFDGRVADVGVDLYAGHLPDRHRIEPFREVVHVRGDDEAPAGALVTDELDRERFPRRDALHLGGDGALAGEMHLREAGHTELPSPVRTGSGSKGVISARAFMNTGGHPCRGSI